ncbi:MAG: hypothetical protein ACRCS5_06030 [Sphingomonas sp.]|uniref:hypothetical protein n=2 Tax=Pseudomonadota TaxID=1224 RepID=UPI0030F54190
MSIDRPNLKFPSRAGNIRGMWAPLLFSPRPGSPEQLVVGVAAVTSSGFHLAEANAWRRLHCLFDADADTAMLAIRVAFERMRTVLAKDGLQAFSMYQPPFSGISLGEPKVGEAATERALAELWLAETSSLYDRALAIAAVDAAASSTDSSGASDARGDRLPILVREYVQQHRPGLVKAFSPEFQAVTRSVRTPAQQVRIAFSGSVLVANFATLPARKPKATIEHIKSLVLDLETDRERDSMRGQRRWEMIVQHQGRDDPHIKPNQYDRVLEVLDQLGEQARVRDLDMLRYTSVSSIGQHLLEVERRAAA